MSTPARSISEPADAVRSVGRAATILEILADGSNGLGVAEIGRRLGTHKATASRLLTTLAARGLVQRDPSTDKYRLGAGLIRLAAAATAGTDVVREARPALEELAERTGDFALASVCAAAKFTDGRVTWARIGLGSVGPTPLRAHEAESALTGSDGGTEAIAEAAQAAARAHLASVIAALTDTS
jgi:DNA-binding MarR family transcriptional regulator